MATLRRQMLGAAGARSDPRAEPVTAGFRQRRTASPRRSPRTAASDDGGSGSSGSGSSGSGSGGSGSSGSGSSGGSGSGGSGSGSGGGSGGSGGGQDGSDDSGGSGGSGGSDDSGGGSGRSGGDDNGGGSGRSGGSDDGGGDGGDDRAGDDHRRGGCGGDDRGAVATGGGVGGRAAGRASFERTAAGVEVIYSNGVKEEIENGRLEMKDAAGRTVIERPATQRDVARLNGNARNSRDRARAGRLAGDAGRGRRAGPSR